ncbi:putative cyclic nucleotide-gated ion channel 14 [Drosera capensis]
MMDPKRDRRVSFHDEKNQTYDYPWVNSVPTTPLASPFYKPTIPLLKSSNTELGGPVNKLGEALKLPKFRVFSENHDSWKGDIPWWKRILDPSSEAVLMWNRIFLFFCLVALFVDPLFFVLPSVFDDGDTSYMARSVTLGIVLTVLRSLADLFYMLHVVVKFRTAFVAPSSRIFGRGELVKDPKEIAKRYIATDFLIDFVAALPLPQVLGACWYLVPIERQSICWKSNCQLEPNCSMPYLNCHSLAHAQRREWANGTSVFSNCDPNDSNSTFVYGIFANAVGKQVSKNSMVYTIWCLDIWCGKKDRDFSLRETVRNNAETPELVFYLMKKFISCPFLVSETVQQYSYGQNLVSSTYAWETSFCILISILGLVLFAQLIGNMQTYLQSITLRLKEWRLKRRDTEKLMKHRQLPENLCARVPFFAQMDHQLLDAICERLKSSLNTQGIFVLKNSTTNGGEELLAWALLPKSTLFSSTRTVKALVEVEALTLQAEDLKFVANQFRRLHSRKLPHTFRFHSHHWRTWAACFIQAAWRRHKKRMALRSLSLWESFSETSFVHDEYMDHESEEHEQDETGLSISASHAMQNLGVTIWAQRFAANTRKVVKKGKDYELPKFLKPEEPDFSAERDDD